MSKNITLQKIFGFLFEKDKISEKDKKHYLEVLAIENKNYLIDQAQDYSDLTNFTEILEKGKDVKPPKGYIILRNFGSGTMGDDYSFIVRKEWETEFLADNNIQMAFYWYNVLKPYKKVRYDYYDMFAPYRGINTWKEVAISFLYHKVDALSKIK